MTGSHSCARRYAPVVATAVAVITPSLVLSGCASHQTTEVAAAPAPPPNAPPGSIPSADLVGRWGFAAYHKETDRPRTEAAARGQCNQPYVISPGPNGGVIMHLADQAQPQELRVKGGPTGKNYLGPDGPAADTRDREIVTFDGRVMVLRWIDPEVAGRYGTSVYVRCSAHV